ncbi:MAG: TonB-dependent receptor, partial [Alphaproteobacteria bacterium]|nr:TonB-dependent receptor [Alphaproteobacteria bacterium]
YGALEQLFGDPVTTSATGSPQRVTEVPVNMIIVTADEIRRSGARDIPGVLRHVPGVDFLQWQADDADVSIRGYNQAYAARVLVLIDGRQVYADYYGLIPWSSLPVELNAIRQIEIVKGPNAALFGLNAVGGTINIITYNPRYDDLRTISLRAGTQGLAEISGVATFKVGSASAIRLSAGYRTDADFATTIPAPMLSTVRGTNDRLSVDGDGVFAITDTIEFDLEASHTHARVNEITPAYTTTDSSYQTNSIGARVLADTSIGLIKLKAYTNWIDYTGAPNDPTIIYSLNNRMSAVQLEDAFNPASDHTLRFALSYRNSTVNTIPVPGGRLSYDVLSASGMWSWHVAPAVSFTNALRIDHLTFHRSGYVPADYPFANSSWDRTSDEISFNSGLVWTVGSADVLRAIASRGVQLPNLVEAGALLVDMPPYLWVSGTPYLKPTSVNNYEVTWDHALSDVDAKLQIAAFHQDTQNIVAIAGNVVPWPTSIYATPANIGASTADGVEFTANGQLNPLWHWSVGYRLEAVHDKFVPLASGGVDYTDFEHTTPKHLVKVNVGWSSDPWEADAFISYQSASRGLVPSYIVGTALVPVGSYANLDARLAYRLADWATVSLSGENLLAARQRQTSGPDVERQLFLTLTLEGW